MLERCVCVADFVGYRLEFKFPSRHDDFWLVIVKKVGDTLDNLFLLFNIAQTVLFFHFTLIITITVIAIHRGKHGIDHLRRLHIPNGVILTVIITLNNLTRQQTGIQSIHIRGYNLLDFQFRLILLLIRGTDKRAKHTLALKRSFHTLRAVDISQIGTVSVILKIQGMTSRAFLDIAVTLHTVSRGQQFQFIKVIFSVFVVFHVLTENGEDIMIIPFLFTGKFTTINMWAFDGQSVFIRILGEGIVVQGIRVHDVSATRHRVHRHVIFLYDHIKSQTRSTDNVILHSPCIYTTFFLLQRVKIIIIRAVIFVHSKRGINPSRAEAD